jgi:hypothetical protein
MYIYILLLRVCMYRLRSHVCSRSSAVRGGNMRGKFYIWCTVALRSAQKTLFLFFVFFSANTDLPATYIVAKKWVEIATVVTRLAFRYGCNRVVIYAISSAFLMRYLLRVPHSLGGKPAEPAQRVCLAVREARLEGVSRERVGRV